MPTALFFAIRDRKHKLAEELLKQGVRVDVVRGPSEEHPESLSALNMAVLKKDLEMVKLLLTRSEIDVDKPYNGLTPLGRAMVGWVRASNGSERQVMNLISKELIEHEADPRLALSQSYRKYVELCKSLGLPIGTRMLLVGATGVPPPLPPGADGPTAAGALRF